MIGIGISIDYSLFILTRFRELAKATKPVKPTGDDRRGHSDADQRRTIIISGTILVFSIFSVRRKVTLFVGWPWSSHRGDMRSSCVDDTARLPGGLGDRVNKLSHPSGSNGTTMLN
jgi:hypothetical protein